MAIKGAFAAGVLQGFEKSIREGMEDRKKRMEDLIDRGISTAKSVAPKYAKTKAELTQTKRIGDAFKRDFNVTDEEFVALVQSTDVTNLYEKVYQENERRKNLGLPPVDREDIMFGIQMPENFAMPEGMSRNDMLEQIMGLRTKELQKEDDPNSEGAKNRSMGKALAKFLVLNPQMSADQAIKQMEYMGYNVQDLLDYSKTGGVKQDVIPGITRTSELSMPTYDYKEDDMAKTQRSMYSSLTRRITGADFASPTQFADYRQGNPDDTATIRRDAENASNALARLELQLVRTNARNPTIAGRLPRQMLLQDIANAVETPEELAQLNQSILSGNAIEVINAALQEGRELNADDYNAIITGVKRTEGGEGNDTGNGMSEGGEAKIPDIIKGDPELISKYESLDEDTKAAVAANLSETDDPQVARMLLEQAGRDQVDETTGSGQAVDRVDTAREVAQVNQDTINRFRDVAKNYTYQEYKDMSRSERRDAGLPARGIDSAAAFGMINPASYFKGGAGGIDASGLDESTMAPAKVAEVAANVFDAMTEEFPDISVVSEEVIRKYLSDNNVPANERLVSLLKMAVERYKG